MSERRKVTVPAVAARKGDGQPLVMVTAYDSLFAELVDEAGVDLILVGDSVGTVVQGRSNTLAVTMEQMEYHVGMVASVRPRALVVGDMPFGSYHESNEQAVRNAVRLVQAGAECVKLEGGARVADRIAAIVRADIPVMGHVGLTPQSFHRMGGHRIQGRTQGEDASSARSVIEDAHCVDQSGAFSLVIEGVPAVLGRDITEKVSVPTIGIGAGPDCDGQVLVLQDILGLTKRLPSFARSWTDGRRLVIDAVGGFAGGVRERRWPDPDHVTA
jgi:3-methyl-2-oxobutanoate hydroxymethyltransferase